jgi:hypothetical protein
VPAACGDDLLGGQVQVLFSASERFAIVSDP